MKKKKIGDSMVMVSFMAGMFVAILSMTLFKFTITNYLVIFAGIFVVMIVGIFVQNASTKDKESSETDEAINELELELEVIGEYEDVESLETSVEVLENTTELENKTEIKEEEK
jgi:low affinity Fe/Cu permease